MTVREEFDMLNDMKKQVGHDLCKPLHGRMDDLLEVLYPITVQPMKGAAGVIVGLQWTQEN